MKFKKTGKRYKDMPPWYGLAYCDLEVDFGGEDKVYYPIPINLFVNYYLRFLGFSKRMKAREIRQIEGILWKIKCLFKYPKQTFRPRARLADR